MQQMRFYQVLILTVIGLMMFAGCSGGGGGGERGGTYALAIAWPDSAATSTTHGKAIPSGSTTIEVSITGDKLDSPMTSSITVPETSILMTDIPVGNKVATIKALNTSGTVMAQRKESFLIRNNQTTTSNDMPLGIAITKDGSSNTIFEPSSITFPYGDQLYFQNWTDTAYTCRVVINNVSGNTVDLSLAAVSIDETLKTVFSQGYVIPVEKSPFMLVENSNVAGMCKAPVTNYESTLTFGSQGTGDGEFISPFWIAFDSSDNIYVTDSSNHRVQKFTSTGSFTSTWGSAGTGDYQFQWSEGILIDTLGYIYISDYGGYVRKFDSSMTYVTRWGQTGSNTLSFPRGMAMDGAGNMYVANQNGNFVQKFDTNGNFISKWGTSGTGNSQFDIPVDVAVDSANNIFVSEYNNNRVQKFNSVGTYITQWGGLGTENGQFTHAFGITIDKSDNVYVCDWNGRVQKFDTSGNFLAKFGTIGSGTGNLTNPAGVITDKNGNVYIGDYGNYRVQKFAPAP